MKQILAQLAAAISFFTRIPAWRVVDIPLESYKHIIVFWPISGWLTGAIMAISFALLSSFMPTIIAIILAFAIRMWLTSGLHEDGLSDFLDGFGGGSTRDDILRIMKDSHIGSYALIGMILYAALWIFGVNELPHAWIAKVLFVADPLSKMLSMHFMRSLNYARTANESKAKMVLAKPSFTHTTIATIYGLAPALYFLPWQAYFALIPAFLLVAALRIYVKKRIGGYTGDLCGAVALIAELAIILGVMIYFYN